MAVAWVLFPLTGAATSIHFKFPTPLSPPKPSTIQPHSVTSLTQYPQLKRQANLSQKNLSSSYFNNGQWSEMIPFPWDPPRVVNVKCGFETEEN